MKKIIFAILLVMFFAKPSYATENPSNGKALLEYCVAAISVQKNWDGFQKKTGDELWESLVKARYCQGLVKGVLGTVYNFQESGVANNACLPANLSVDGTIKIVVDYLQNNPEALNRKDVEVIMEALIFKYMCN